LGAPGANAAHRMRCWFPHWRPQALTISGNGARLASDQTRQSLAQCMSVPRILPSPAIGRCVAPRPHGAAAALHTPRVEGGLSIREGARLKASWRVAKPHEAWPGVSKCALAKAILPQITRQVKISHPDANCSAFLIALARAPRLSHSARNCQVTSIGQIAPTNANYK